MDFRNTILLTGAGFSANFGGFLAREMWSWIFNNPQLNDAGNIKFRLKDRRVEDSFDFEKVYSEVFDSTSAFSASEISIFREVVNEAYFSMDDVIQSSWDSLPIHPSDLRRFLDNLVTGVDGQKGICFTLNQDLVMEKRFNWQPLGPTTMIYKGSFGNLNAEDLNSHAPKVLPTRDELEIYKSQSLPDFRYVKLHGSLRWVSQEGEDHKVIGINKINIIAKIPLLNWYFDLFKEAISTGNTKLLIIGYSFRDPHINNLLADACENKGLKLFIISPSDPEEFSNDLLYRGQGILKAADMVGSKIWKGVEGYFPYKLSKIFPLQQRTINPELDEIYKSINS